MMTQEETKNVVYVYDKLMKNETENEWTSIDDIIELIQMISDKELFVESSILYSEQKGKNIGCPYLHKEGTICFVTNILEAVESIIDLYEESRSLHANNRYILEYYVALCENGNIIELMDPQG